MPVRKQSGETKDEFIQRCMSIEESSFPDRDQRYAVCISYWTDTLSTQDRVTDKINRERQALEGACWPNYIQIGTKIKDGREVPDCRGPIE